MHGSKEIDIAIAQYIHCIDKIEYEPGQEKQSSPVAVLCLEGSIVYVQEELDSRAVHPVKEAAVGPSTKPLASEQKKSVRETE